MRVPKNLLDHAIIGDPASIIPRPSLCRDCCRVKARFSNQHKRLRHDFFEEMKHHRSLSGTFVTHHGVKSDAKMTPTIA